MHIIGGNYAKIIVETNNIYLWGKSPKYLFNLHTIPAIFPSNALRVLKDPACRIVD